MLARHFRNLQDDEQIYVFVKQAHHRFLYDNAEDAMLSAELYGKSNDVYFGVNPRLRGSFDEVSGVVCAWADLDLKDFDNDVGRAVYALDLFPVSPTCVVNSGHGFHAYWYYDSAVSLSRGREISAALQRIVKSDPVSDPERLLRVPGTLNLKDTNAPAPVTLEGLDLGRVYSADEIESLCRLTPKFYRTIGTGSTRGFKSRSERDWAVLRELILGEVPEETIRKIAEQKRVGDRWRANDFRLLNTDMDKMAAGGTNDAASGFVEHNGAIYYNSQRGKNQVSTFVYEPKQLLVDLDGSTEDVIVGTVTAGDEQWEGVTFPRSAFVSASAFQKFLPSMYWQWLGSDFETKRLLLYWLDKLAESGVSPSMGTGIVGRHEKCWVCKTMTVSSSKVYSPEEAPIAYAGRGNNSRRDRSDTTPSSICTFPDEEDYTNLLSAISTLLPKINKRDVIIPMLGWFMAAPFKPLLHELGYRFPHLNVFGTMGSGKTYSITKVFMPLLGMLDPTTNTANTTAFVLRTLLSRSNALPVIFGEFRESTTAGLRNDFFELLRMSYDKGQDSRGRADLTTTTYRLLAPIIVDGEDAFADPALKQRSIIVNLHPETIEEGGAAHEAFQEILEYPLIDFAGRYIQRTLRVSKGELQERYDEAYAHIMKVRPEGLHDRPRNNLTIVQLGLDMLNEHLRAWGVNEISETDNTTYEESIEQTIDNIGSGLSRTMVDDFTEDLISYLGAQDRPNFPFMCAYDSTDNILWFHFVSTMSWWEQVQRRRGRNALASIALRAQLKERANPDTGYVLRERKIDTPGMNGTLCFGIDITRAYKLDLRVPKALSRGIFTARGSSISANNGKIRINTR